MINVYFHNNYLQQEKENQEEQINYNQVLSHYIFVETQNEKSKNKRILR